MKRRQPQITLLLVMLFCSTGCLGLPQDDSDNKPTPFEPVDLGLPSGVLWASQNLGADRPWDLGEQYAWGESDTWNRGEYSFLVEGSLTGYNYDEGRGVVDDRYILDPEDDVATVKLGAEWRMPTKWDFEELRDNCIWEKSTHYGVSGFTVTSKVNTNSIFLPAHKYSFILGLAQNNTWLYWTSCLNYQDNDSFKAFSFAAEENSLLLLERDCGLYIRPVKARRASVESIALKEQRMTLRAGKTKKLGVVFIPIDALDKRIAWSSEDSTTAYIDAKGNLTALFPGETRITAFSEALNHSTSMDVTIDSFIVPKKVDLGLPSRTLWADRNLSSIEENDIGLKFAWGELRPKVTFSDLNYIGEGKDPDIISLDSEHDAAAVILGPGWHIPNTADFRELADNCEISYDLNTRIFTLVSRINGNKLHLPPSYYWTSSKTHIFGLVATTGLNGESSFKTPISVVEGYPIRPIFN